MLAVLLGLIPLFGWGVSDYIASRYASKMEPALVNVAYASVGLLVGVLLLVLYGMPEFSADVVVPYTIASFIVALAFLAFLRAFDLGAVGVVSPIGNAYALVTALLAATFLDDALSALGWFAAVMIVAGISVISYEPSKKKDTHNVQAILWALVATVLFGTGFYFYDVGSTQPWYHGLIVFQFVNILIAFAVYFLFVRKQPIKKYIEGMQQMKLHIGTVAASLSTIGIFVAIDVTDGVSIPVVISAGSTLVTAYLAYFFDHERLDLRKRIGAVVVVAGIMLLSV